MGYESDTISTMSVEGPNTGAGTGTAATGTGTGTGAAPLKTRPHRPCDACRKRKSRCELPDGDSVCVLCQFHKQTCTFVHDPPKKKRRTSEGPASEPKRAASVLLRANSSHSIDNAPNLAKPSSDEAKRDHHNPPVRDYADLRGPSLLKRTLGLQNHRHSALLGPTSIYESRLLPFDPSRTDDVPLTPSSSLRKVGAGSTFLLTVDAGTRNHAQELDDLDAIESIVAPHGQSLINLYFRIVHPTYPILHKRVFLEKYARTHREFSPPLLAAVYILALNWWSYAPSNLSLLPRPDRRRLEDLAFKAMADVVHRPKLSTIQAGLLLLQRPEGDTWALTTQIVGLAQDLGLHRDCSEWRVPGWEKGLRKRLAWAVYVQDKWGSLTHGRPSHITGEEWDVRGLTEADFPERAADEDEEEGSTEVEKGRVLFCEMIRLTGILADVLGAFYTVRAERELADMRGEGVGWLLGRAKPLQLRLKSWFADLPECLRLQDVAVRKLSSTGYLHLAYYAAEITLHRRIVQALEGEESPELVRVCRVAARERLVNALEFVNRLRPEHLQSFWYSASEYNFALIGTFISLLWATARSREDAAWFRAKGDEYRWTLRLSSKNAEILERAIGLIAMSSGVLVKALPEAGNGNGAAVVLSEASGSTAMAGRAGETAGGHQSGQDDLSSVSVVSPVTSYGYGQEESETLPLDTSQMPWFEDAGGFGTDMAGNIVFGVDNPVGQFLGYSEL
ncbi:hypothetical protein CONLIGDRAFT_186369 [Coniochaeta ligniaria NRRL 30616]|uniref:Zn(2)-C6 fungal-type domain-containing protein n=1 Tax=Coniochaeta ligniaria NRRL 30616 TaxID=1408157 RepID=A0A1J7J2D8_9PEZI|nr:hypothetical protein CONLIGDRAFT_186369 [Coniochaeta ligniaria NRRL 30616]